MKRWMMGLLALLLLAPAVGLCGAGEGMTVMVATDLHYLAPELTDHGPFFEQLIGRGDGKVMDYSEELAQAFVDQVIARRPDALILSGDLTFNGARKSHEALAQKLQRIADAGIPVLVLPGNHDLNNRGAACFSGDGYERVESVTAAEFAQIYAPFGFGEALSRDDASLSFVSALGDGLRVLMLDTNTAGAPNQVTEKTLAWAAVQLADAQRAGCRVITVSHQNLLDQSSLLSAGFTIGNADALRGLYASGPVLCNLSGHVHMQHISGDGEGLFDIATSSLAVSPNQYGVLTISPEGMTYRTEPVDVSAWARAQGLDDPNLLDFARYADDFFKQISRSKALAAIMEDEDPEALAGFFAELNAAYFAGRLDQYPVDWALLRRWQRQPSFTSGYIESIAEEGPRNACALSLDF